MTERVRLIGHILVAFAAVVWFTCLTPRAATQTSSTTAVLRDLSAISELQSLFDRESDRTRIVLLLSPTWPACIKAAQWAQQDLLGRLPNARIRVYAVWFNMYPGDARAKWPSGLLTDSRVIHFWDEPRAAGTRYLDRLPAMIDRRAPETMPPGGDAMWDAFFIYPAGDRWLEPVPVPLSWGYPIMVTREHLLQQIKPLLAK